MIEQPLLSLKNQIPSIHTYISEPYSWSNFEDSSPPFFLYKPYMDLIPLWKDVLMHLFNKHLHSQLIPMASHESFGGNNIQECVEYSLTWYYAFEQLIWTIAFLSSHLYLNFPHMLNFNRILLNHVVHLPASLDYIF